jgi:hypothetical protein
MCKRLVGTAIGLALATLAGCAENPKDLDYYNAVVGAQKKLHGPFGAVLNKAADAVKDNDSKTIGELKAAHADLKKALDEVKADTASLKAYPDQSGADLHAAFQQYLRSWDAVVSTDLEEMIRVLEEKAAKPGDGVAVNVNPADDLKALPGQGEQLENLLGLDRIGRLIGSFGPGDESEASIRARKVLGISAKIRKSLGADETAFVAASKKFAGEHNITLRDNEASSGK